MKKSPNLLTGWQKRYFVLKEPGDMVYYENVRVMFKKYFDNILYLFCFVLNSILLFRFLVDYRRLKVVLENLKVLSTAPKSCQTEAELCLLIAMKYRFESGKEHINCKQPILIWRMHGSTQSMRG